MNRTDMSAYPWQPIPEREECCAEKNVVLSAEGLSLLYQQKTAFQNVTMPIHRGCITALVGPSGCGKTSFLMSMNRLAEMIPGAKVTGKVLLDGEDIYSSRLSLTALRRRIGMIFQKPNPFPISIRKNVTLPLREHRIGGAEEREEIMVQALKDVGLWNEVKDRLDAPALALSGGQQQRLCIARALVLKPEVLLMDEPCSALDPISSGIVEDLISSLRRQYTVMIVTHNLAQARRIADFTGVFWVRGDSGQLVEFGPTGDVFEQPKTEITAAYIGGARG